MTSLIQVKHRVNREGWPLLTVKMEVNGDSKSTNERGPSLVGSLGSSCRTRDFYPVLAAVVSPVQNILFLAVHYFNLCVPIAQQPGQEVVQGRLSLCVSGQTYLDYLPGHFIFKVWWRYATLFFFSTLVPYKYRWK
jgi:hypothetical protein